MSKRTHYKNKMLKDGYCPFCHSVINYCSSSADSKDSCNCYEYCDCCDVKPITSCLKKMEDITECVFECLEMRPTPYRELRVAFCILLTEISAINDKLDCISQALCKLTVPCREESK